MKLIMLGTGSAMVTKCYNTCFLMEENGGYFLVDGGGGNAILARLKEAGVDWRNIKEIFVTHKHIDHLMGIIWMIRIISHHMAVGEYDGSVDLYSHDEVIDIIMGIAKMVLREKEYKVLGERIRFISISDGESRDILGHNVTFFDLKSNKAKQYGFSMQITPTERLCCLGDEPYTPSLLPYVKGCKWLLHDAFCLESEAEIFDPFEKQHSTVTSACKNAEVLGVQNLVLYHTEDTHLPERKHLYLKEGIKVFSGHLFVPDDLETIEIC